MSSNRVTDDDSETNKEKEITSGPSSRRQTKVSPHSYKVGVPAKQKLWEEFKSTVKETLFPDEPLRSFKNQPKSRKFLMGMEAAFPILQWGREYNLSMFKGDLIAGLTIASLCIPQVIINLFLIISI